MSNSQNDWMPLDPNEPGAPKGLRPFPDTESAPEWTRLIDWSNPRVWLREAVKAASAWLMKPTKAEAAHVEAGNAAGWDWAWSNSPVKSAVSEFDLGSAPPEHSESSPHMRDPHCSPPH